MTFDNILNIIVLLILAGITISALSGENGILNKVAETKEKTDKASEIELIQMAVYEVLAENLGENITVDNLNNQFAKDGTKATASGTDTIKIEFETGRNYMMDSNGKIKEYIKVGDYVDYEPTKVDLNKTQDVDESKLTYQSPVGEYSSTERKITHGNGHGVQTFTANANDETENGLKWRVLSISDDKIELISDVPVKTDSGVNFALDGAIGYLYAEQELNEICKIYGYGYGADTSVGAKYMVGGPHDVPVTGEIEGTGARSITIVDLNKIANITELDFTTLDPSYGSETNPTEAVYYPTLSSTDTRRLGKSSSKKTGYKYTYYNWDKTKIVDASTQSMLFNVGSYWIASRSIETKSKSVKYWVRYVSSTGTNGKDLCTGYSTTAWSSTRVSTGIRPVVTLKSNVIDINTDYTTVGEWKLK